MRLNRLRLRNFRQHADTEVRFRPGLTGIIGPNGAGKSTILEAIAWALYGAPAARGTNDTIRFARAAPRSRVEVELEFALGGHEYRVVRTLNSAEVYLDGGAAPVAATLGGATAYLQGRVGMSREEFFNTYFTGQKELQFLSAMGPTERGRFLSQVLGYERLRRAQDLARARRGELRHEIMGLRTALGDLDEIVAERRAAEQRVGEALGALSAAREAQEEALVAVRELAPRWEQAQAVRDRHRELAHAVVAVERERETARRDVLRAEEELKRIAAAEAELAPLRAQLEELPSITSECERMARLAREDERRKGLERQVADLEAELGRSRERLAKLEQAPELERQYGEELERLREERAGTEAELDEQKTAWLRDRQDAQTKLQNYRDRGNELREQIRQIRELGPEGKCPTCGRPVGDDYERLLEEMEEQWTGIVQDGKWWKSRAEQLEEKPEEVAALERLVRSLAEQIDDKARRHTRCKAAVEELKTLQGELAQRAARRDELRRELETIPAGYDRDRHREVDARLRELRELETRAARLEESTSRRPAWERDRTDAVVREQSASERVQSLAAERDALGFSEEGFAALRAEYEGASERNRQAEMRVIELGGHVATAEQALQSARRAEAEYHQRAGEVAERETELRYHEELDLAFSELRGELNAQVRPELSEIASAFLAQLTDGRYTSMEIDDAYNLMVLDEGEEKPVISGGEEDVANLVLRLSLSQMIAERAGHPLSLLILDEVFGSLDVARRDNVVQLLHHLEDRFEQVILITHIEGIRESLDQVLRVEFDERMGTSVVREESFSGDDLPEPGMAAD
ncbi:MAG TPA: SMC family ATPase [Longimicrobiaceae bacterium]|nr:SMC family ATPase [Longimicrobiaceae bacterium]